MQYMWFGGEFIEKECYENYSSSVHHYHVDPRFAPKEFYSSWEVVNDNLHNVIEIQGKTALAENGLFKRNASTTAVYWIWTTIY